MNNVKEGNDLNKARRIALALLKKISASKKYLPTFGYSKGFGYPFIEINSLGYNYVVNDRGTEVKRITVGDIEELMYYVFFDISFQMAIEYELNNRERNTDSRRKIFRKQEELLGLLNIEWKNRAESYHNLVLEDHPFDDYAGRRAEKCQLLKEKGFSEEESWELACKEFPLEIARGQVESAPSEAGADHPVKVRGRQS